MESNAVSNDIIITAPSAQVQPDDTTIESQLTVEITTLWSEHVRVHASQKATSKQLRLIRATLSQRLYEVKSLLSRPGRSGEWCGWLKQRGIPRSTADRLVTRYAESLTGEAGNCPSEAISPDEDVIDKLLQSILPRLRRVLTTKEAVLEFVLRLATNLDLTLDARNVGTLILTTEQIDEPTLAPNALADDIGFVVPETAASNAAAVSAGVPDLIIDGDVATDALAGDASEHSGDVL
jgi:hypothetical protein